MTLHTLHKVQRYFIKGRYMNKRHKKFAEFNLFKLYKITELRWKKKQRWAKYETNPSNSLLKTTMFAGSNNVNWLKEIVKLIFVQTTLSYNESTSVLGRIIRRNCEWPKINDFSGEKLISQGDTMINILQYPQIFP